MLDLKVQFLDIGVKNIRQNRFKAARRLINERSFRGDHLSIPFVVMHVKFAADIHAIQYMLLFIIFKNLKSASRILRIYCFPSL